MSCRDTAPRFINPDLPGAIVNSAQVFGRSDWFGPLSAVSRPSVLHILDVQAFKTAVPAFVRAGETARCIITVRSRSTLPITQVRVADPDAEWLMTVKRLYVNGRPVPPDSLRLGAAVPDIAPGRCAVLTYDAIPPGWFSGTVSNTACVSYRIAGCGQRAAVPREPAPGAVRTALEIVKEPSRCAVSREDPYVTYTLTITNPGTRAVSQVMAADGREERLLYVPGTTALNGGAPVDQDPASGVQLGTLSPGETAAVTFQMKYRF